MSEKITPTITPEPFKVSEGISAELPLSFTPSFKTYAARFGVFRVFLILAVLVFGYFYVGPERFWYLLAFLAVFMPVLIWRMMSRRVTVTDTEIIYRNGWGVSRRLALSDIGPVNLYSAYIDPSFGAMPRVLIGNKEGKHFLSLLGLFWDINDMERLALVLQKINIKTDLYTHILNWGMMSALFPKLVSRSERHPILIALATVGIGLLVLFVWAVATVGFD